MKRSRKERQKAKAEQEEVNVSHKKIKKAKKRDGEVVYCSREEGKDPEGREEEEEVPPRKKSKKEKKRKKKEEATFDGGSVQNSDEIKPKPGTPTGRHYTVSIALPGSIIDNAQTQELKTYLAGQIARAAAVFSIDEIIVFNEQGKTDVAGTDQRQKSDPNTFLARLLQYQETPQYLRKVLFPMHHDLKYVGILNPLDCPHHMRMDDVCPYREGIVMEPLSSKQAELQVDCGMRKKFVIDKTLPSGTRVTVRLSHDKGGTGKLLRGEAVAPSVPRTHSGLYWGYNVRLASSLSAVFTESPYVGGYDVTIGTSERGETIDQLTDLPSFQHLLVVFGGLRGLEYSLECDVDLQIEDVSLLFHHYLNTCPGQGSRTIRTEEALLISLAALRPLITRHGHHRPPETQ